VPEARRLFREIVDALAKAHRAGVVHRDVKPENVLLADGHALVTDFGIAKAVTSIGAHPTTLTMAGVAVGTPAYMAPEQAAGEPNVDQRADLYAAGIVAYEMLTGAPPFTGPTAQRVLAAQVTEPPPPIAERRRDLPADLAALVMALLAKEPDARPASADEVLAALDAGLTPGAGTPAAARAWRRRILWGALPAAALALGGVFYVVGRRAASPDEPRAGGEGVSIAVLPFVNLSADTANAYFSDGITEEILNALAQIPTLRVAARTSAFQFKGRTVDLRVVGRELDVGTVLEGSVQRAGDQVRVTAQLIDARTGYHLWSGTFDRQLKNLFAVEDEISRTIADTLRVPLGLGGRGHLVATATGDPAAHELYLKGLSLVAQRGPALRLAIVYFDSALARDSLYAPAHAGLAQAYELLPSWFLAPWETALPRAEAAARRALSLDGALAPAYAALASVHRDRWQWARADSAYQRALALSPNDPETIDQYAQFLGIAGRLQDALAWMERARRLDPLSPVITASEGAILLTLHHADSAVTLLKRAAVLAPTLPLARFWLGHAYLKGGHIAEAQAAFRRGAELAGADLAAYDTLVRAATEPALRPAAIRILVETPDTARWELGSDLRIGWLALLGERARALDALEHFITTRQGTPAYLWFPALDPLRQEPRFAALLARAGLPYRGGS
jgi:serine/threonine-protein kinase